MSRHTASFSAGARKRYAWTRNAPRTVRGRTPSPWPPQAWYQVWGDGKQVLAGGATADYETMDKALESEAWSSFQERLLTYVTDFELKVVEGTGGFQL